MKLKQMLIMLTTVMLVPLQLKAEQIDAWTRADNIMDCEVVSLEREGLHYSAELMSYYDGIIRAMSISLADGRSLAVGDVIPCAMVTDRLIAIKGYDTELYRHMSKYKIEPLTIPVVVGVRVVER